MTSSSKHILFTEQSIQGFKMLIVLNFQSIKLNRFYHHLQLLGFAYLSILERLLFLLLNRS